MASSGEDNTATREARCSLTENQRMRFVKVGRKVVNIGLVAWAEMDDKNNLSVHFCVPRATAVSGSTGLAASDHYVEEFSGAEAEHLWDAMLAERGGGLV
jgi:hypothetical protein